MKICLNHDGKKVVDENNDHIDEEFDVIEKDGVVSIENRRGRLVGASGRSGASGEVPVVGAISVPVVASGAKDGVDSAISGEVPVGQRESVILGLDAGKRMEEEKGKEGDEGISQNVSIELNQIINTIVGLAEIGNAEIKQSSEEVDLIEITENIGKGLITFVRRKRKAKAFDLSTLKKEVASPIASPKMVSNVEQQLGDQHSQVSPVNLSPNFELRFTPPVSGPGVDISAADVEKDAGSENKLNSAADVEKGAGSEDKQLVKDEGGKTKRPLKVK